MSRQEREIPQRELRNNIARILREVAAGARLRITVRGRPVADLVPTRPSRWFVPRDDVARILRFAPLDRGFGRDLEEAAGATVEDL